MKLYYVCECCQDLISELEVDELDEDRLGFSSLTDEERQDIISVNEESNKIYINSLCDECISALGLDGQEIDYYGEMKIH